MKQKKFLIGVAIFIFGGIVGGLVFTRHYNVGPLANLASRSSSANEGQNCNVLYWAWATAYSRWESRPSASNTAKLNQANYELNACTASASGSMGGSFNPELQ